ncbi:MAG: RNA polymerase sigma factor [Bacteroidota bacterium]|nr:RNA polymerase sigma factor [Bacteroidota bacterium]
MNAVDDHILVRESLDGNRKAFEQLVNRYYKKVFNVAFRIVNNSDAAADVTQSVFLKTYEHLDKFKERYKFFSWLYKIAINESLNNARDRKQINSINDDFVSIDKGPDEKYNDLEKCERIQQALMKIGIDYRTTIVLNYFHGLSYDEIGYVLEIPAKTVKSRLFTARKLLRNILIKEEL